MIEHENAQATDSFLHLTDLHFWKLVFNPFHLMNKRFIGNMNVLLRRRHEFLKDEAEVIAQDIAGFGVKDIIITGDFSSTALDAEFTIARDFVEFMAERHRHVYLIPGNHDVYTFASQRTRRFVEFLGDWMPEPTLPATRHLTGGTPVVFVPTITPNLWSSRGRITSHEVSMTREQLEQVGSPVVVAGHYPMLKQTYGYTMSNHRDLRNAETLRKALGESGRRILYISGHVHRFTHVQDPDYPNLTHMTSGALFRLDPLTGYAGDLSEIRVVDGDFRVFRHRRLERGWTREEEGAHEQLQP